MEDTTTPNQPDESLEACMSSGISDSLNTALIAARAAISPRVFKANHNQHQRYQYVSHEHVLVHARQTLLAHGLLLEQRAVQFDGELTMAKSTAWRWSGIFALVHKGGEERLYTFSATTQPNDKAAYVASTSLDKVALMRVLQLAGTDDENAEADWHDNQPGGAAQPAQRAPEGPKAAPSNVVRFEARQRAPEPAAAPEWAGWLEAYAGKMRQRRTPKELVDWWVQLVTTLPEGVDKGFVGAAWRMFRGYAKEIGHDFDKMRPEIDKRVLAAKKAEKKKKGGA